MSSKIIAGRYELLEKIGDGGMAVVYKAKCRLLNRYVAVKILKPEFVNDAKFLENFRKESHAAASLSHPNIVNVYDVGKEGNINFIVMELVTGQPLSELIKEEAPMDYKRVVELTRQIAAGLSVAHKHNIIHRDVKPHNILITEDGVAKITDFGIAKAVKTTTIVDQTAEAIMGSVHYFSPEQARGGYVDEKSDIYSLGIVMYEMLTGQVPFDGENPVNVALKHINEEMVPPSALVSGIPPRIEQIVMKASSKLPTSRFSSADEMIKELDNIEFVSRIVGAGGMTGWESRHTKPIQLEKDGKEPESNDKAAKTNKKKRMILLIAGIALLLIAGFVAAGFATGILGSASVEVPDVRGMTIEEATDEMEKAGLKLSEGDLVYSSEYEIGEVVSTDPAPGSMAKEGSTVEVNICKGAEAGTVPDLTGKTLEEATGLIEKYGFKVGNVETKVSSEPKDTVIDQDPKGGAETSPGDYINIVVSDGTGKEEVEVPYLIGKDLEIAKQLITDAGFKVGEITYGVSTEYDLGQVTKQQYEAGAMLAKGSTIDIKVAGGSGTSIISLDISYADAKQEVFYLTVVVKDDSGTRTVISGEERHKSDGGDTIEVEGVGNGTITIIFDEKVVMTKSVVF
jgi:eukaryotic-like serine/threonine-protein kinase